MITSSLLSPSQLREIELELGGRASRESLSLALSLVLCLALVLAVERLLNTIQYNIKQPMVLKEKYVQTLDSGVQAGTWVIGYHRTRAVSSNPVAEPG